jgi:hypothetical protein
MLLVLAVACTLAQPCSMPAEPRLPPGITCEQVRALVAEHGYAKAVYWARANGYSWAQIYEAKKCLR